MIDPNIRASSIQKLEEAENSQYAGFIVHLCTEFAQEDKPAEGRQLCGLYLKNMISSNDPDSLKTKQAFPETGDHVMTSYITTSKYDQITQATLVFFQ